MRSQDLLLGEKCCFDFSGEIQPNSRSWTMKCCDGDAPVVTPNDDIDKEARRNVSDHVQYLYRKF